IRGQAFAERCFGLDGQECPSPHPSPTRSLLIYVHVLRVDDAFVFFGFTVAAGCSACPSSRRSTARRRSLCLRRLVHLLGQFVRSRSQRLARFVHLSLVIRLERLLRVGDRVFHVATIGDVGRVSFLFSPLRD